MNNRNPHSPSLIRAHRERRIKPDPGTQSKPFLDFKAALIKAGGTTEERKGNSSAIRAARTEAKSYLLKTLSAEFWQVCTPEIAAAAARKEALKIVNRWSRLVFKEAEKFPIPDEQTPSLVKPLDNVRGATVETPPPVHSALETPLPDALAVLLEAKPRGRVHSRKFDVEMCYIHRYVVPVRAANIEEAHVLARQTQLPPQTLGLGLVRRTLGIDNQPVRLVHEDLSRMTMDHLTGDLWDRYTDGYDDGD